MAKKTVKVNEDAIRSYMAGDTSESDIGAVTVVEPVYTDKTETKTTEENDNSVIGNGQPRKKRCDESSYKRRFLKNTPQGGRIQVYMDRSLYENIKRFLPVIAPNVSLSSYITNIVTDHIEQYIGEINRRYKKSFSPINLNTEEEYDD